MSGLESTSIAIGCEDLVYSVSVGRKFAVFTAQEANGIDEALHFLRMMLHEQHGFESDADHMEVQGCFVVVLFREREEFVLVCRQNVGISAAFIDVRLQPCLSFIIGSMNSATFSLWEPLELTPTLAAGMLVTCFDGNLSAKMKLKPKPSLEVSLTIENDFIDAALVDIASRDRLQQLARAVSQLEAAMLNELAKLELLTPNFRSLEIRNRLKISADGTVRPQTGASLLDIVHGVVAVSELIIDR